MKRTPVHVVSFLFLAIASAVACSQTASLSPDAAPSPAIDHNSNVDLPPQRRAPILVERPKADARSSDELEQAACRAPSGAWRCANIKPKTTPRAALGAPPVIPSTWTVPAWFVDPANSSGTASDANSCTSSGAPCLTWHQINDIRWECQGNPVACPRLRQNTTITWLSSQSGNADPVYIRWAIENGAVTQITGTPTTVGTGTLANNTAKNKATPQLLQQSVATVTLAAHEFIVNSTHASSAWTYKNVAGAVWSLSQPLTTPAVPMTLFPTENNSWANSDNVTVETFPTVDLVDVEPILADFNGSFNNVLTVSHVTVLDPNGTASDGMHVGAHVQFQESSIQREILGNGGILQDLQRGFVNCDMPGGAIYNAKGWYDPNSGPAVAGNIIFFGGILGSTSAFFGALGGAYLDADIILNVPNANAPATAVSESNVGTVYIETGTTVGFLGPITLNQSGSVARTIWGPGNFNALGRLTYGSGAGAAAAEFLLTGTLSINNQTKACVAQPGAASSFGTCNLSVTATQLDTSLGATAGCLSAGGGGAICNFGP